jgi:predicted phage replisome organizer
MADVKWIKVTTDIFDDEKILLIESLPSADGIIVVWFKLLTFAGKQNNDGVFLFNDRIPYTDEMLASIFRRDVSLIRMALKTFQDLGMIEIVENVITIPNWNKHQTLDAYEKKKERDRIYAKERRAAQKALVEKSSDKSSDKSCDKSLDCKTTGSSDVAVSEEDKEKDKEKDKEINKRESIKVPLALAEKIKSSYPLMPKDLCKKLEEWVQYKAELGDQITERGIDLLVGQVTSNSRECGSFKPICDLIDNTIINGWRSIPFERLDTAKERYRRQVVAEAL